MGVCPVWRVKSVERGSLNFKTVLAPLGVTHTLVRSSAGPLLSPGLCGSQGATEQGAGAGRGEAKKPQTPGEALPPSPPRFPRPDPCPSLPPTPSLLPRCPRHAPTLLLFFSSGPARGQASPQCPCLRPLHWGRWSEPPSKACPWLPAAGPGQPLHVARPPEEQLGSSLVVQWFELGAFTGMCLGLTPGLRTEL